MRRLAAVAALALVAAPAHAAQRVLFARGHWAALQSNDGRHCQAITRSLRDATRGSEQARAAFAFDAMGKRRGQLHVRLSRGVRDGSSVLLSIGDETFLLVARGLYGWSVGPAQEAAMMVAARRATGMRVEARDGAGRRFIDHYLLAGAPSAIDAAAARCAS